LEYLIGKTIDNYKIISLLGEGGMGIVYKGFDLRLERFVAIKIMHPRIVNDKHYRKKFKNEAKHQAKMIHPNIVAVFGFIEYGNLLGIVMEYVDGETAESLIKKLRKVSVPDTLHIIKQVLYGLHYAHSLGFIHRDIKPSNIIINENGTAKVMDFGISTHSEFNESFTPTDGRFGTVFYLSPEQIKGQGTNIRSDIYSIGCTMYEMLTGYPPFYSSTDYEVLENHVHKIAVPPSNYNNEISPELDSIILKALSKNYLERFISCGDMNSAIKELKAYRPTSVSIEYTPPKSKLTLKNILMTIIAIAVMFALTFFVYRQVKFDVDKKPKPDSTNVQPIERFVN
jgi:eukaryotic-like serine/threonine-protein kinase